MSHLDLEAARLLANSTPHLTYPLEPGRNGSLPAQGEILGWGRVGSLADSPSPTVKKFVVDQPIL